MWVLELSNATLKQLDSPESIPGGYAILSHVWDKEEQSFKDIQKIGKRCARLRFNPRRFVGEKIRQFCIIAERDGHKWGWADTCCIDKASSAELSEAINSTYRYCTLADTCYAYLRDVSTDDTVCSRETWFRKSRWHKRGWTLQELIAPVLLIFLSRDWERLGTKAELAEVVEEVTEVPVAVLTSEKAPTDFSIAQRMSWAANRKITRLEDEAYCLMGLFGINMPTLYGEGRFAFRRLQEEIMRQTIDTTLFAWGVTGDLYGLVSLAFPREDEHPHWYLFATSPSDFRFCKDIFFIPFRSLSKMALQTSNAQLAQSSVQSDELPLGGLPTFSITPYGVHARVPVFTPPSHQGNLIAVLYWGEGDLDQQKSLGLPLRRCLDAADPLRPLYYCGDEVSFRNLPLRGHRLDDLLFDGESVKPMWTELYIAHTPPPDTKSIPRPPINSSLSSLFHFPRQQMELLYRHGFDLVDVSPADYSWDGYHPMCFVYRFVPSRLMVIRLGRCLPPPTSSERSQQYRLGAHWATVNFYKSYEHPSSYPKHSCAEDHICDWPDFTKTFTQKVGTFFREDKIALFLTFTPWGRNSNTTLVVNLVVQDPQIE